MNSTLAAEKAINNVIAKIDKRIKAIEQELGYTTVRVDKEVRQISTTLKKETGEDLARYAVESKRVAGMDMQIIGFIKPLRKATKKI